MFGKSSASRTVSHFAKRFSINKLTTKTLMCLDRNFPFEFGASQLRVSPKLLQKMLDKDLVTISPCGAVFVKSSVREGVLPRMVREILDCRQMVKQSMKLHKNDKLLQRVLHSRQLGLKLMANVTYGYTAANFSGRMPCVEVSGELYDELL